MGHRSKVWLWLERILLTAGVLALGVWAGSKIVPPVWQAWQNRVFDRELRSRVTGGQNQPSAVSPRRSVENGSVLGRLSIPRLQLSSIVREGDDETTLSLALGHIPGTAFPGDSGNVGVAGHRDTIFRPLRQIRKDDLIRFETLEGTRVYSVDSTRIVKPTDVSVLRPQKTPGLTLVTCYPFYYVGSAPDRFIVSAHEIPAETAQSKAALRPAALETVPAPVRAVSVPIAVRTVSDQPVRFNIAKGHTQRVTPGISLGVTDTDPRNGSVYGWMVLTPDQRTVLLQDQLAGEPLVFYQGGQRRELRFTSVSASSATGSISTH